MGFQSKNPDLLAEQYRNVDELIRLGADERSLSRRLEAVRERRHQLRLRNEEICYLTRPASAQAVTRTAYKNGLRYEVTYQSAA